MSDTAIVLVIIGLGALAAFGLEVIELLEGDNGRR